MPRYSYVNGRYVPHADAMVHVEDRGYQFADAVYEVIAVIGGRLIDETPHLNRLDRSLAELSMAWPVARSSMRVVLRELVRRNRLVDGKVYVQVSRGVAHRDFAFPAGVKPSLVMTATATAPFDRAKLGRGISVVTLPDQRWARCDIKTVGLLAASWAKQRALEAGADEALLVDKDGLVTEGTSCNAWIVTSRGALVTRQLSHSILAGVTRGTLLELAGEMGLKVEEKPFSVRQAKAAREAFVTSATALLRPVVRIDGKTVGDGKTGPVATKLLDAYAAYIAGKGDRP